MTETEGLEGLFGVILGIVLVILVVAIAVYVLTSILMNNVHKRIYGKGNWMAWVPYCRTYLLGQLAVNKLVGIILVSASVLTEILSAGSAEGEVSPLASGLSSIVGIANLVFLIMLLIKNGKLKRGELSPALAAKQCDAMNFDKVEDVPTQPVNNAPAANPEPQAAPAPAAKRFCTNCGSEIPDNSAFCTNCGTKVE